ncbi:hypothetical protein DDE82_004866 [Stemphylium lycopersici]|uniref:Uncharacterized protein n=1 Tax=Stemphylium lycopersici TaxID=183478 RepID=A0A364MUG9_STELY|nr:hypothetical protein TW65_05009 [Stemphylium lycopersici]RAR03636.1 hypothetical protein DDE83_008151 [Stemphylium lycopersici]RAR03987.1 hypothetical protein DDE82_004866 [Stemphylium lycopersici]
MAATTRARTGNSKPRVASAIESAVTPTTKRSSTTKANTSKPRTSTNSTANKVVSSRVTKPKATTPKKTGANVKTVKKPRTKTEKVVDKVVGKAENVIGDVEGKPGKKAAGTAKARGTDSTTKRAAPRARAVKA